MREDYYQEEKYMHHRLLAFAIAAVIGFVVSAALVTRIYTTTQALDQMLVLTDTTLSPESEIVENAGVTTFSLFAQEQEEVYVAENSDAAGVYEFLEKNIEVDIERDVKGVASDRQSRPNRIDVLPGKIAKNLRPARIIIDADDSQLMVSAPHLRARKHYYLQQHIDDIPIYGSSVSVHLKDEKTVYAILGNYVNDQEVQKANHKKDDVVQTALEYARAVDGAHGARLVSAAPFVVNKALLGIAKDGRNIPSYELIIDDGNNPALWSKRYVVSLTDKEIIAQENQIFSALSREICDYSDIKPDGTCDTRGETSDPSSVVDVEQMFGALGTIYNFYDDSYTRDSFDDAGARLEAVVDIPKSVLTSANKAFCPNAAWSRGEKRFLICTGFAVLDVVAHEFAHAVVDGSANLQSGNQSGTLNEGVADILATGVKTGWLLGEDLPFGYLRDISDPAKNRGIVSDTETGASPGPDRLYSEQFYCGTGDNGGVHRNLSVVSYAHYLMSEGGSSNGCQIDPITKEKSLQIWYVALTRYLGATANFRDAYNAVSASCNDLYGQGSVECVSTLNALRAVEMDQQPLGEQTAAKCLDIPRQPPQCEIIEPPPSPPPVDTCPKKGLGDADCDGVIDAVDYVIWKLEYTTGDYGGDEDGDGDVVDSDFDAKKGVTLADFNAWVSGFNLESK